MWPIKKKVRNSVLFLQFLPHQNSKSTLLNYPLYLPVIVRKESLLTPAFCAMTIICNLRNAPVVNGLMRHIVAVILRRITLALSRFAPRDSRVFPLA
jgi:hypothetical protein